MTVSFILKEMTVDQLETLLSLLDPTNQERAYSEVSRRIRVLKSEDSDIENL